MQKNSQSFIRELIKFLKSKIDSKPTYEEITLLRSAEKEPDKGFIIQLNKKEYLLLLYVAQSWGKRETYINLRDTNRPEGKQQSFIQLTINERNFKIDNSSFEIKQIYGLNIGNNKEGFKREAKDLMQKLGFNKDNTILKGEFNNPDFETITKNLFKWLRIRATAKLQLEKKYRNSDIEENDAIDIDTQLTKQTNSMNSSKNIILYGPPGTGKTYNSIDKSVEISAPERYIHNNHEKNKKVFDELRQTGQIEFVTFHQNYSYEDFMVGLKPDIENEQLRFRPYRGIFYEIAKRARENYLASKESTALAKTFDEAFNEKVKPFVVEGKDVSVEMASGTVFKITDVTDYAIYFKKPKGDSHHTLSIQTLQDIVEGRRKLQSGLFAYYNPLVDEIKEIMKQTDGTKIEVQKNFVLVIDEINRANISKVFGELITLLEDDKRLGADNELKISLPNGENDFGVPPNLFIIGTMNTADKSIALIDIALRRRFEFIGKYPEYDKLKLEESSLLQKINATIFEKKKSADYLIGHAYFMKNLPIETVLRGKVVPLLMEYFSGKTDIVSSIFEGSGWTVNYNSTLHNWEIKEGK